MQAIQNIITPQNAALSAKFIFSLDKNAIAEKYQTLGLPSESMIEDAKKYYRNQNSIELAQQLSYLYKLLTPEAQQELAEFLIMHADI